MPDSATPQLILASQSPRRAELLRDAGYRYTQQAPPFADPDQPEATKPHSLAEAEAYAAELARQKAVSMVRHVAGPAILLAADTLCVSLSPGREGALIGKPRDRADALSMLQAFMDTDHAVVSGVALIAVGVDTRTHPTTADPGRDIEAGPTATTFADTAIVTFGRVPAPDLERYLDTDHWRGKAGGYNLFDRQRAGWPITVAGDPTTVVGLPMGKLASALTAWGVVA